MYYAHIVYIRKTEENINNRRARIHFSEQEQFRYDIITSN